MQKNTQKHTDEHFSRTCSLLPNKIGERMLSDTGDVHYAPRRRSKTSRRWPPHRPSHKSHRYWTRNCTKEQLLLKAWRTHKHFVRNLREDTCGRWWDKCSDPALIMPICSQYTEYSELVSMGVHFAVVLLCENSPTHLVRILWISEGVSEANKEVGKGAWVDITM